MNPIHYFFEQVNYGVDGSVGNIGDKNFRCYHGNQKIITLTKSMKYNLMSRLFTASAWMTSTNFLLSSTDKPPQEHIPINVQAVYIAEGPLK